MKFNHMFLKRAHAYRLVDMLSTKLFTPFGYKVNRDLETVHTGMYL